VVTPVDAVKILTGAKAIPIGAGGTDGTEGSTTMLIKRTTEQATKVRELIEGIKGEPSVLAYSSNCEACGKLPSPFVCPRKGKNIKNCRNMRKEIGLASAHLLFG
jgi:hypothetical protein